MRRRGGQLRENAEFVAITLLAQNWDSIAEWLIEELFADEVNRRAFLALAAADGDLDAAIDGADPDAPRGARTVGGHRCRGRSRGRGPQPDRCRGTSRARAGGVEG